MTNIDRVDFLFNKECISNGIKILILDYCYILSCTFFDAVNSMNIIKSETPFLVKAKTTGCNNRKNRSVTYHFIESAHTLCLDKEELLQASLRPVRDY